MRFRGTTLLLLALLPAATLHAGPLTATEGARQSRVWQTFTTALAAESTAAAKLARAAATLAEEPDPGFRHRLLQAALALPNPPAPDLQFLLTRLLTSDPDAGLRVDAATALGNRCPKSALDPLLTAAASDPLTALQVGDVVGQSSARRAARFAIAALARRFPDLAPKAAAALRALPSPPPEFATEQLADAREQALYQITRDPVLLTPFLDRLKSPDPKTRTEGIIAFRFLALTHAPPQLLATLHDPDPDVLSWTALALGEIPDPASIPALIAFAADPAQPFNPRCNALQSLARLHATAALPLLHYLLANPALSGNAQDALNLLTTLPR